MREEAARSEDWQGHPVLPGGHGLPRAIVSGVPGCEDQDAPF
jgi:hypothetical protein